MKRSQLPSQKKYRLNNPSASFRLKAPDKENLDLIVAASGKPLSQWMTDFLHDKMDPKEAMSDLANKFAACKQWGSDLEEETKKSGARIKELEARIKELETEQRFFVFCPVCKKPVKFSSKHSDWASKVQPTLKEAFGRWHHTECIPK
jgi:hypothetical protein